MADTAQAPKFKRHAQFEQSRSTAERVTPKLKREKHRKTEVSSNVTPFKRPEADHSCGSGPTDEPNSPTAGATSPTDELNSPTAGSTSPTDGLNSPTSQSTTKHNQELVRTFRAMKKNRRRILKALIEKAPEDGQYLTCRSDVSILTDLADSTVKRNLKALEEEGFITKETYRSKQAQGLIIKLSGNKCKSFLEWLKSEPTPTPTVGLPTADNTILDRQTKSLSLSVKEMLAKLNDEDIAQTWPEFYSFGFTHSKFQELIQRTDNLGRDLDKLILIASLDSIELELSKGDIKDAKGNDLDDVLGYFFRSIMNNGNYKPHISANARKSRGEEIREMLRKAEIADAWVWWNSLSKEMRKTIYQGGFPSDDRLLGLYYEHGMLSEHTNEKKSF